MPDLVFRVWVCLGDFVGPLLANLQSMAKNTREATWHALYS